MSIKVSDWVKVKGDSPVGLVTRAAKNGSWVDVNWGAWTKRMKPEYLEVVTTIKTFGGMEVTDVTREAELKARE